MTIRVKQHYRTVNGKLVLVHEHDQKGNAAQHPEPSGHDAATDDEFDKLFGDHQEEASAPDADLDAEFDKLFSQQTDDEFDKLFGESVPEEPASETTQEPEQSVKFHLKTLEAIGGKEWKSDDGKHHRVYFNGIPKLWEEATGKSASTYGKGAFKGSKVFYDFADNLFHSKNLDDGVAEEIMTHLKEKALKLAQAAAPEPEPTPAPASEPEMPEGAAPKVGEKVPANQVKPGMVMATENGHEYTVTDVVGDEIKIHSEGGNDYTLSLHAWDDASIGLTFKSYGPKVGDTKVVEGKTYILNANHRWELVEQEGVEQSDTQKALEDLGIGVSQTVNGIAMKKSTKTGNMLVYKKDADDKPLPKKVKDALKGLHPTGYKVSKYFFVVDKEKFAELAEIIDGKAQAKPKAKKPKAAPIQPVTIADSFPFTQIGPQAGSNEGGLFQDSFGKKWYIKFPASEDHAKNELLAAKLYKLCGIDVPHLKLVKKDGKVGIASAFQEGLKNDASALKAGVDGAKGGFGVDAWLANWDSVGLSYDNMPVKDGRAFRVDVGGSLIYRAQGGEKGEAFGNVVTEIDTLRDPSKNPQTASVFGSMTDDEMQHAVAKVLAIPDDAIHAAVMKFGPGDETAKKALIKKLQARKAYLAKRFPEADALANPPAPDPAHLKVDPAKIGDVPNFHQWKDTGKGLSSNEAVNAANQQACQEIHDFALKGDLVALKAIKMPVIDKSTGAAVMKPAYEHPSQWVREYYDTIVGDLEVIANPASTKAKSWDLEDAEDIRELSDAFPAHLYGVSVSKVPANERLGFWISLGNVSESAAFVPKNFADVSSSLKTLVKKSYTGLKDTVKSWLGSVQSAGNNNQPYRDGSETDYQGRNTRDVLEGAYAGALEFPEGTTIRKWIKFPADMEKQLKATPNGHVFQNPGSMCCSMSTDWESGKGTVFGNHLLTIRYAKGAKGLPTAGSGSFHDEQEITTLPGQRFMILNQGKLKDGSLHLELLMLPPDETYVANIKPKKVAA